MDEQSSSTQENKNKRGRPPIKPSGSPLTSKERRERHTNKKEAELEAKRAKEAERKRKRRATKAAAASAAMNEDPHSTDTGSVASSAPPTPIGTPASFVRYDPNMFRRAAAPTTPISVLRSGANMTPMPRTPLTADENNMVRAAHARREKIRERKIALQQQNLDTTQQNNNQAVGNLMEIVAQSNKEAMELVAQRNKEAMELVAQRNKEAFDVTNQRNEELLNESIQDGDMVDDMVYYAKPAGGSNLMELYGIPEESAVSSPQKDDSNANDANESDIFYDAKDSLADESSANVVATTAKSTRATTDAKVAATKKTGVASKAKSPPAAKKRKGTSGAVSSAKKRKFEDEDIDPLFAVRILGAYPRVASSILAVHSKMPDMEWKFNLLATIKKIKADLDPSKQYKFRIIGDRNTVQARGEDLGLPNNKDLVLSVPRFLIHVFEAGSCIPNHLVYQESVRSPIVKQEIGKGYNWVKVGPRDMDIMVLSSNYRESSRALDSMTEEVKAFAKSAQLWFPSPLDLRTAFPYDHVKLGDIFVSFDDWVNARGQLLKRLVQERDKANPDWCAGLDTKEKKRKVWNEIYLEPDEDKFVHSLMDPMIMDYFTSEWEDELAEIEDGPAKFLGCVESALRKHHAILLDVVGDWDQYKGSVTNAKHYVVFPENDALQIKFLHSDNSHINHWIGKADGVFPKPTGKGQTAMFQDEYTFDDIPQDERTRQISVDDALNRDGTKTSAGDGAVST